MIGFPKVIKTKADLLNTHKLAKRGRLKKEDWLAAVTALENQNWMMCPVVEMSEDRKTVTLMQCAEAATGQKVKNGSAFPTISAVQTVEVDKNTTEEENAGNGAQEAAEGANNNAAQAAGQGQKVTHTILTLSKALLKDTKEIGIQAATTFYDRLGITPEEVEALKEELAE